MTKSVTLLWSHTMGHVEPDQTVDQWFETGIKYSDEFFCQISQRALLTRARLGLLRGEIDSLTVRAEGISYSCDPETGQLDQALYRLLGEDPEYTMVREMCRLQLHT